MLGTDITNSYAKYLTGEDVALCGGGLIDPHIVEQAGIRAIVNLHHADTVDADVIYVPQCVSPEMLGATGLRAAFLWVPESTIHLEAWAVANAAEHVYTYTRHVTTLADCAWNAELLQRLDAFPTAGMWATVHLLRKPIHNLSLTGFTWYITANGEIPVALNGHAPLAEMHLMREWYRTGQIEVDYRMEEIFNEHE